METETCRSCGAKIIWATTLNGRSMPVDAEPNPEQGNLFLARGLSDSVVAITLSGLNAHARVSARRVGVNLFTSHFATCPDHAKWRKS